MPPLMGFVDRGSPPRVGGKAFSVLRRQFRFRIIPACAGKSFWPCTVLPRCRDHPRVCGEKNKFQTHGGPVEGSPPRMRGKAFSRGIEGVSMGITPAYAGKRMVFAGRKSRTWDHPRVCGEKLLCCMRWLTRRGSPPRMRGKVHCPRSRLGRTRDHPRVCGEKWPPCRG